MIFCGYQGVGKSSICNRENGYIDFESSNFFVNEMRPNMWVDIYINQALSLNEQGYDVFLSTHKTLRNRLNELNIDFVVITPCIDLKEQWIERLTKRYRNNPSIKNMKALNNAEECYEENVNDLCSESKVIMITNPEYDLKDFIEEYKLNTN